MIELCLETARRIYRYEPDTGKLIWIDEGINRAKLGTEAGFDNGQGYLQVCLQTKSIKFHRLCWALYYGAWPKKHIDHRNGDKKDNRIENLREATMADNCRNTLQKRAANRYPGVRARHGKFAAEIQLNGKKRHLGTFENEIDAATTYAKASVELHGEFSIFKREGYEFAWLLNTKGDSHE